MALAKLASGEPWRQRSSKGSSIFLAAEGFVLRCENNREEPSPGHLHPTLPEPLTPTLTPRAIFLTQDVIYIQRFGGEYGYFYLQFQGPEDAELGSGLPAQTHTHHVLKV